MNKPAADTENAQCPPQANQTDRNDCSSEIDPVHFEIFLVADARASREIYLLDSDRFGVDGAPFC